MQVIYDVRGIIGQDVYDISQDVYDVSSTTKRLSHEVSTQSEFRPGSNHNLVLGTDTLRLLKFSMYSM